MNFLRGRSLAALVFLAISLTTTVGAQMNNRRVPYEKLEEKAHRANALQRESIRNLAHEVLTQPHLHPLPAPIVTLLEEKLTTAEVNFRMSNGPGVNESQLVDLLNSIQLKLGLPTYEKTTAAQVRTLRVKLAMMSPHMMGDTLIGGQKLHKGDHVCTEMAPLQAMHLLEVMIDQKILNPDYQDPSIDLLSAERQHLNESKSTQGKPALQVMDSKQVARKQEVQRAINEAVSAMTIQDVYDIVGHALATLRLN